MRRPLAPFVVFAALSVAACSASDATPATVPETAITASATDPAATTTSDVTIATTSSIAPTTEPPETTSSTTTTETPPTTLDPTTQNSPLFLEIQQALLDGESALTRAFEDPADASARAELENFFAEGSLENIMTALAEFTDGGLIAVDNPAVPQQVVLRSEPALDPDDPTLASAEVCRVDAGVVLSVAAESGGTDIIVDDTIQRVIAISRFVRIEDRWKLAGGTTIEASEGVISCDAL